MTLTEAPPEPCTDDYYTAAVEAMSTGWKAFFYGSLDSGSFITVDKPPAALGVMALSARVFGFSTWSMLLPQALSRWRRRWRWRW